MKFINLLNNTEPIILHLNGSRRSFIQENKFNELIINSSKIKKPEDLTIITCATEIPDCYSKSPLIKQLNFNNIDFINIGKLHDNKLEPWSNLLKIKYLYNFIKDNTITTKYVCFLDAADILLSEDFDKIISKFLKLNNNLVWGSQIYNYPEGRTVGLKEPINDYEKEKESDINNFLCSGVCIGFTDTFIEYINITYKNIDKNKNIWNSDQYEIKKTFRSYYKELNVDYDSKSYLSFSPPGSTENDKLMFSISQNNNLIIPKIKEII